MKIFHQALGLLALLKIEIRFPNLKLQHFLNYSRFIARLLIGLRKIFGYSKDDRRQAFFSLGQISGLSTINSAT